MFLDLASTVLGKYIFQAVYKGHEPTCPRYYWPHRRFFNYRTYILVPFNILFTSLSSRQNHKYKFLGEASQYSSFLSLRPGDGHSVLAQSHEREEDCICLRRYLPSLNCPSSDRHGIFFSLFFTPHFFSFNFKIVTTTSLT